jgi:hypothetical protein
MGLVRGASIVDDTAMCHSMGCPWVLRDVSCGDALFDITAVGLPQASRIAAAEQSSGCREHLTAAVFQLRYTPVLLGSIDLTPYGSAPNSVAVRDGIIAVAVEATVRTDPGSVVFFNSELQFVSSIPVGAVPDMVTFTPNGRYVLSANEGEPSLDYSVDPEGSVSIIDVSEGLQSLDATKVRTADFHAFNNAVLDPNFRTGRDCGTGS